MNKITKLIQLTALLREKKFSRCISYQVIVVDNDIRQDFVMFFVFNRH